MSIRITPLTDPDRGPSGHRLAWLASDADGTASDLEARRQAQGLTTTELERMRDAIDDRDASLKVTYVMLGVGAGLAATGALLYYMDMPRPEAYRPPAAVTAIVGAGTAGVALVGRF